MELIYLWVEKYRNIEKEGFNFSSRFDIEFNTDKHDTQRNVIGTLSINPRESFVDIFKNNIRITGIIGENGSGKTSILELLQDYSSLDAIFMIFYSDNKLIFQNISKAGHPDKKEYTVDEFATPKEVSLSKFTTMDISSIYYNNILEEPGEVLTYSDDFLDNKFNISSSYNLNNTNFYRPSEQGNRNKIIFRHIYSTYYSDDILKSVSLFSDLSTDIEFPFEMPRRMSISCKNIMQSKLNKLLDEISSFIVFPFAEFSNAIQHEIDLSNEDIQKLIPNFSPKMMEKITLKETDSFLENHSKKLNGFNPLSEDIYYEYANPIRVIFRSIEDYGVFEDFLLLNIVNHFLSTIIRTAPYRDDIFRGVIKSMFRNKYDYKINAVESVYSKKNYEVIIDDADEALLDLYATIKRECYSIAPTEFKYFDAADNLINIFKDITRSNSEINQRGMTFELDAFNHNILVNYNKLVATGDPFLLFGWFPKLSSGQLSYITFFSRLYQLLKHPLEYETVNKNILLLIDEGDLTLHPQWQQKYIYWLYEFLSINFSKDYCFHIIITSHSPFISSDLLKEDQIFLKNQGMDTDKSIVMKLNMENTFGSNILTLLNDGFYMSKGSMGEFAKNKINKVVAFYNEVKIRAAEKDNQFTKEDELQVDECEKIKNIIGDVYLFNTLDKYIQEMKELVYGKQKINMEQLVEQLGKDQVQTYLNSLK